MLRAAILVLFLALVPAGGVLAADAPAAPSGESHIPFKRGEDSASGLAFRVVAALGVVVLLAIGGAYALKHYLPTRFRALPGSGGRIKVVEVQRLTPSVTLFLLELDGTRLLIAQAGDRVTRLYEDAKADSRSGID